jgi:hypothetical protein
MPVPKPKPVEPIPAAVGGELAKLRDKLLRSIARYTREYAVELDRDVTRAIYHELMAAYGERKWATMGAQVRASLAQDTLAARVARRATEATQSRVEKVAAKHIRPWKEVRMPLSRRLHGFRVAQEKRITRAVLGAIRDGKNLTEAGTKIIHEVRKTGAGELAGNAKIPRYMEELEKNARALYDRGSPADWRRWQATRKKLKRYMGRLAEGGRVKNNLLEILQNTKNQAMPDVDRIMHFHAADKQKYAADRILRTETSASFRSQQVLADSKHKWIIGYIWRMNRAARAGYTKRTRPRRLKGTRRRHRCICEFMDSKQVSKDWLESHPAGGHPHCMCTFEPVVDNARLSTLDESDL